MVPKKECASAAKRIFDLLFALSALIVLSPIFAIAALMVRMRLGSPVFFRQIRPGLHGKPFVMLKFRTMADTRDQQGNLLPDEARLTKFGKTLRSTSLDELPELWNILKGDMSIVGPRPLLERYIPLYTAEQRKRHQVRPGLTGLAQVNGRNELDWEQKFQLDTEYTMRITFISDIKIILQTIGHVFTGKGISSTTSATMEEFLGNA